MTDLILKGSPRNFPKIDKGVGEYFFEQAERIGDNIFQIDGVTGKQETYREVKQKTTKVALQLRSIGIQPKDIVLLCCKNNLDNIIPALATQYLGAYVSSIDPKLDLSDVKHSIALLEPKLIVVEKDSLDLIENGLKDSKQSPLIITIGSTAGKYPNMLDMEKDYEGEHEFRPVKQKGSDIAGILLSSGTTSAPKGIYLTNSTTLSGGMLLVQHNHLKPGVILHLSSLYWVSAWTLTFLCIVTGTAKVVAPAVSAEQFFKIIEKYQVTYAFCSSTYTYQLTDLDEAIIQKYDTSSLYSMIVAGSTIDPNQILRMRKYFPHSNVNLGYACSEANVVAAPDFSNKKAAIEKVSSSGTVLPEVQIKFVDTDTEKLLGPNKKGEIRVKSDLIMAGYHNYSHPDLYDEDGFLKVGDAGYYDDDGYIYVTDRLSEIFKYQTHQISPTILENVLLQHPAVAETVAFGIPHAVDRNHPAACVVLNVGVTATPDELEAFVKSQVPDYYQLRGGLLILEAIPKTPTGKVQRRMVKDHFVKLKKGQ